MIVSSRTLTTLRYAAARSSAFWRWWIGELAGLLPLKLRHAFAGPRIRIDMDGDQIVIGLTGIGATLEIVQGHRTEIDALKITLQDLLRKRTARKSHHITTIVVPSTNYSRQTLRLPSATKDHLSNAVKYQLGRLTPLADGDVLFATRARKDLAEVGILLADVALLPKRELNKLLQLSSDLGLEVHYLAFAENRPKPENELMTLRLTPPHQRSRLTKIDRALIAISLALVGIVFVQSNLAEQSRKEALQFEIERLKPLADKAIGITRQIELDTSASKAIVHLRDSASRPIAILDALAVTLEDDVRLSEYRVAGTSVTVSGHAQDATRLLSLIEQHPQFRAAKYTAPVTRDQGLGTDRFSISFQTVTER